MVRVCGDLIMGPRCLDFICGCQEATMLFEEERQGGRMGVER